MILDAHAHLFHPRWYPQAFHRQLLSSLPAARQGQSHSAQVLIRALSDATGEANLRAMDRAGIDRRIILVLDWGLELGEAELSIEAIHHEVLGVCRRFADRLTGFAGVDPRRPQAPDLLEWAFDEMGARGLKLHPTSPGWTLADERTLRLVELTAVRQLPVLVHIGGTFRGLVDQNASPDAFMRLVSQFPETTFVAGHAGFRRWREFGKTPLPANALLDISGWQSLDDGTDVFADELAELLKQFDGQVVFGTDSPFFGLPAAGADGHWLGRVQEIAELAGKADGLLFDHPALQPATAKDAS